jgi:hypothetical protein
VVAAANGAKERGRTKARNKELAKQAGRAITLGGGGKLLAQTAIEQILQDRGADEVVAELMALKPAPGVDWSALSKHDAVRICKGIKLKSSDSGLWEKGDAANSFAIGGRIYQEAYEGDWNSYEASARGAAVTHYQFRSPAEWFADAYSAFYLNKLPDSHPLVDWLISQNPPAA